MNGILACTVFLIALFAWVLNTQINYSTVYPCSEVTKQDPEDVQRVCAQAKRNRPWMN
jgi:hypothetical protein